MRAVTLPFLMGATLLWATMANAGPRTWVIECGIKDCEKTYAPAFAEINQQLTEIWSWLNDAGFRDPQLKDYAGANPADPTTMSNGPRLLIQNSQYFNKDPSKNTLVLAHFDPNKELMAFNAGANGNRLKALFYYSADQIAAGAAQEISPNAKELVYDSMGVLAHELYHAVQLAEGDVNAGLLWISEGTARAVEMAWAEETLGAPRVDAKFLFDKSLPVGNKVDGGAAPYERGVFFLQAGKYLPRGSGRSRISYLANLFAYPATPSQGTWALDWLDQFMRDKGRSLHEVYNRVVADYASSPEHFNNPQDGMTLLNINEPETKESTLDPWSAHARFALITKDALKVPDPTEDTAFLPLVTLDVPEDLAPKHARLIVLKDLTEDNRADWLVDPKRIGGAGVQLFTRVTNMPRNKLDDGKEEDITLRGKTSIVEFIVPTCVAHGEGWEIETKALPEDYPVKYEAERGTITNDGLYTAPGSGSEDTLYVHAWGGADEKFENEMKTRLTEIELSKRGCPFRVISADGYSFTYDPKSEMAVAKGPDGPEQAYFDREFIYAYDPGTGWLKMKKSIMAKFGAQMSDDTGGLMELGPKLRAAGKKTECKPYDNTGPDPFTWGRAPFDFLADLEYNRLSLLAKTCSPAITLTEENPPCPARAPECRIITILGKDSIVYTKGKQIVEIRLGDGTIHQVKRVNQRIIAPAGAKLIKF